MAMDRTSLIRSLGAAGSTDRSGNPKWTPRRTINKTTSCSSNKSVFLHDWWLIKANGKGLAIGGFTHKDERIGLFCSAVIIKRLDTTTLETADGMVVMISGQINRQRSHENGFPHEVWDKFMLGFPFDWEIYSARYSGEKSSAEAPSTRLSDKFNSRSGDFTHTNSPTSLDDIPVRNIRGVMSLLGDNESSLLLKNIYDDIQRQLGRVRFQSQQERASVCSTHNRRNPTTKRTADEGASRTQTKQKMSEVNKANKEKSGAAAKPNEEPQNIDGTLESSATQILSSRGVSTRSMTKLQRLINGAQDNALYQSLP